MAPYWRALKFLGSYLRFPKHFVVITLFMRKSPPLFIFLLANLLALGLVDRLHFDGRIGRTGYLSLRTQAERINSALRGFLGQFFP